MRTLPELLSACHDREPAALDELVRRFQPGAMRQASALLDDTSLAEDAVQNAFVIALTRLDSLRDPEAFAGWWRQIVRTACSRMRRARTCHGKGETLDALCDARPSPHDQLEHAQLRCQVRAALALLTGVGRETAELYYLQELSCAQVADHLGVPPGTIKRRLHDARARLREMLLGAIADPVPHTPSSQHLTRIPNPDTET